MSMPSMGTTRGPGRAFRTRILAVSAGISLLAVAIISLYLAALIRLPAEQWRGFGLVVALLFPVLFVGQASVHRRIWDPLVRCLDRRAEGRAAPEDLRAGFRAVSNLPIQTFRWGGFWWGLGGVLVAGAMELRFDTFTLFTGAVMVVGSLSGGLVMMIFHYFAMKGMLQPLRETLAAECGGAEARRDLVEPVPVARKLLVSITSVTVITGLFSAFLAQVQSARPIERNATRVMGHLLAEARGAVEGQGAAAVAELAATARRLAVADQVGLYDPERGEVVAGDLSRALEGELAAVAGAPSGPGDSTAFDSPNVLAWAPLGDGRVLVAVSQWSSLQGGLAATRTLFAVLLAVSTGVAFGLAFLLARDVSRATEALRGEAERLASGDLRRGRVFESEDELGELSRSFEGMAASLRETVSRVVASADRVEGTATQMAGVSETVAGVTADQVQGLSQATASMEAIHGQVRGIAESSQALNVSVEESSSSVLELGAAGEELNETAGVLSEKVEEVSSSIEQMIRSVRQVSEGTEALSEASVETSASMEEMASAMREVDASAEQTSELGRSVVSSAERGRGKVRETMEGMEAIREATETAASVMRGLSTRTQEIGAIVDVIDDVADETNLLALNAAIIAAQAGEHGRAFSVVADEIKDLADRVLASTKEIAGLIRAVQEESQAASGAIGRGAERVAQGVDLSAEAGLALEEITGASRESGTRIAGIVSAVREQTKAAGHVAALMERVRGGVEQIRQATAEQDRGNEVVYRGSEAMREVARQVRGTTEEQARGSRRIRESVEGVREAVDRINSALQEQSAACRSALEFLETVFARTQTNEESARTLDAATKGLLAQAEDLRDHVQRFRIE